MNTKQNIPFSPPDITEREINEVADVLRSGWITTWPRTRAFENKIAAYCHTDKAVCLNSATAIFENVEVQIPGDKDKYLTNLYHDYMQLPPMEKRERHFIIDFKLPQD